MSSIKEALNFVREQGCRKKCIVALEDVVKSKALTLLVVSGVGKGSKMERKRKRHVQAYKKNRLPRRQRKEMFKEALGNVTTESLKPLSETWANIEAENMATLSQLEEKNGQDLTTVSENVAKKMEIIKSMELRGAKVRVNFASGHKVRREVSGVILDVSSNAILLFRDNEARPIFYPKRGTKLQFLDFPQVSFWCDMIV